MDRLETMETGPHITIPYSDLAQCTLNPNDIPKYREQVGKEKEIEKDQSMDPPAYPPSTHSIRCPTCKTLISVAKLRKNTEDAIKDANEATAKDTGATPQTIRNLDADIAAMFHDGQPAQAIIDTNLRFGYAATIGLSTLLSYLINADVESEDDVAKAGVAVQIIMSKFSSERAARDPIKVKCCAIAPRQYPSSQLSATTHEARNKTSPSTKKSRLASIGATPNVPRQTLSAITEKPAEPRIQPMSMRIPVARHFNQDDHTITVRYAPVGSEVDPVILPAGDSSDPLTIPSEDDVQDPPNPAWTQPKPWTQFAEKSPEPTDLTVPQPAAFLEIPLESPTSSLETPHAV